MTTDLVPDPLAEPTMTVERAGRIVGISRGAAYEAVRRGDLPALRIGRRWVVCTAQLRQQLGLDVGDRS
jgi:excisionase family DNA binding protein